MWGHSTLHNIHIDTNMDMDMECGSTWSVGNTPHSVISIWIQIWIWECIVSHTETLHNIHMDTNMDMDRECIISHMETLHNIYMDTNMDMNMECIISHMETLHGV